MKAHKSIALRFLFFTTLSVLILFTCMQISFARTNTDSTDTKDKPVRISTPTSFAADNTSDGISLSWKTNSKADGYYIYKGSKRIKTITDSATNTFLDTTSCKNAGKYTYRISAFVLNDGRRTESRISKPLTHYYLRPVNINQAIISDFKVDMKWNINSRCDGYEIEYSTSDNFAKAKKYKTSKTSLLSDKLSASKNYYFRIRSYITKERTTYYSSWTTSFKVVAFDSSWKYASNSKIHSASVILYYSDAKVRHDYVVCVNAGHGTLGGESKHTYCHPDGSAKVTDGTASKGSIKTTAIATGMNFNDGTPERTANLAVAKMLKTRLLSEGYNVLMIRETDDVQLDNIARTVFANNNANCHISIHYDSTASNKGAFYTGVPNISSYRKMEPVASNWKKHESLGSSLISGLKSSGVKIYHNGRMEVDLTQTSYSTIASTDVELGDKCSDRSKKTLNKITDGLVNGINIFAAR